MTLVYERSRILPAPDYTGEFNWSVQQPIFRPKVADYIAEARELNPKFEDMVRGFSEKFNFPINIKIAEPKTEESATRKLWDRKASHLGRPEMLKDYGRGTITIPVAPGPHKLSGIQNLDEVVTQLVHSQNTVAYKDQFFHPNTETGFRSFKAIWAVDGHFFELLVDYAGMDDANKMTKHLRSIERNLKDFENELPDRCISRSDMEASRKTAKMTNQVEEAIQAMRDARLGISELHAEECGLNALLDPSLRPLHGSTIAYDFLGAAKASRSVFAKPAHAVISRAMQVLAKPPELAYN